MSAMVYSLNAKFTCTRGSSLYKSNKECLPLPSMGNVVVTEEELVVGLSSDTGNVISLTPVDEPLHIEGANPSQDSLGIV